MTWKQWPRNSASNDYHPRYRQKARRLGSVGIERYQKRLKQPWDVKWELLPHSSFEGDRAREEESERILERLDASSAVVLLDETGNMLDSPGLATYCDTRFTHSQSVTFVIGGAYGVSDKLQATSRLYLVTLTSGISTSAGSTYAHRTAVPVPRDCSWR